MIIRFEGGYRFLSTFFPAPVRLDMEWYPIVEHAFQAAKTLNHRLRVAVRWAATPDEAKRQGRKLELRADWNDAREGVMLDLLCQKFEPGTELARALMNTGNKPLVEGNAWHDNFWGDCRCGRLIDCSFTGENRLGELLMRVRRRLREMS